MRLTFTRAARRDLKALPRHVAKRAIERLEEIAMDPFASHRNVEALKGAKDLYRLRLADWRAIYRVDRAARAIVVQRIAKRGEVYR